MGKKKKNIEVVDSLDEDDSNFRIELFRVREFDEIMEKWRLAEGAGNSQEFLEKTGLDKYINITDFNYILSGEKIPDRNTVVILSSHLPNGVIREKNHELVFGILAFKNAAKRWQEKHSDKAIFSISNDKFNEFKLGVLDDLSKIAAPQTDIVDETEENSPNKFDKLLTELTARINEIGKQRKQDSKTEEEVQEILVGGYLKNKSDYSNIQTVRNLLQYEISDDEITAFFENLVKSEQDKIPASGKALKFLRNCEGLSQTELGQRIGVALITIAYYENGNRKIPAQRRDLICDAFNLSDENGYKQYFISVWRRDNLFIENLLVNNPNPTSGELLRAARKEQDLTQNEFGNKIGVQLLIIYDWENGSKIPINRVEQICKELNLSDENGYRQDFIKAWRRDNPDKYLSIEELRENNTNPTSIEVLKLAIEIQDFSLEELGKLIGVTKQAISEWEKKGKIPENRISDLCQALKCEEHEDFWLSLVRAEKQAKKEARIAMNEARTALGATKIDSSGKLTKNKGNEI
ncbi:MAG: helix-turn-helix transcriptional regulator [Pseudomonadota bacterium]